MSAYLLEMCTPRAGEMEKRLRSLSKTCVNVTPKNHLFFLLAAHHDNDVSPISIKAGRQY
jgi:hypothetical protein